MRCQPRKYFKKKCIGLEDFLINCVDPMVYSYFWKHVIVLFANM